jgi:hypothetical protein
MQNNMKNLWTFGCSFTHGDGTLVDDLYRQKYKISEDDLPWTQLLSNELNLNLINKGLGGLSNESILDLLINNWDFINADDIVIIGKTWSHRFDFPKKIGSIEPQSIVYRGGESDVKKWFDDLTVGIFSYTQIECIKTFSVEFATQPLYSNRHDNRFNFIKNRLIKDKKVKICYIWDVEKLWNKYDLIVNATNNEIIDHHWSYKGHNNFFKDILNIIQTPKLI